jgi:hypothetical protein
LLRRGGAAVRAGGLDREQRGRLVRLAGRVLLVVVVLAVVVVVVVVVVGAGDLARFMAQ